MDEASSEEFDEGKVKEDLYGGGLMGRIQIGFIEPHKSASSLKSYYRYATHRL